MVGARWLHGCACGAARAAAERARGAGLLGVILLLGYGLVCIPKTLWREADAGTTLKRSLHKQVALLAAAHRCPAPLPGIAEPRLWSCRLGAAATRLLAARTEMQKVRAARVCTCDASWPQAALSCALVCQSLERAYSSQGASVSPPQEAG